MAQKLPVNNFDWIKDTSQLDFMKNYKEEFLPERMKIEKFEKLVANLHDKSEYVIYIINLTQTLNHGLILKIFHKVIKYNQNDWLKLYIDINTDLRKKRKK